MVRATDACNALLLSLMIFPRYGVDEPRISHSLVEFARNLPDSFDPIAKRKFCGSIMIRLDWIGLGWTGWDGIGRGGIERDGMGWDGT